MENILNVKLKQQLWTYIKNRVVSGHVVKKETTEFLLYTGEESALGYITIELDEFPRAYVRDHQYHFFRTKEDLLKDLKENSIFQLNKTNV